MADTETEGSPAPRAPRRPNARGQGELLREEILSAATRLLDELGDDETLSLRALARQLSIAPTSVYLYFPDRDALVLAALQRCHEGLVRLGDEAAAEHEGAGARLRALVIAQVGWAQAHPGLYKVLHESAVHRRHGMPFKRALLDRTAEAVRRCMETGEAPEADADAVAFDLRVAVHGMLASLINEPDLPRPGVDEQVDRFLTKLVGLPPSRD